jgi:hypothetical protein
MQMMCLSIINENTGPNITQGINWPLDIDNEIVSKQQCTAHNEKDNTESSQQCSTMYQLNFSSL